MGNNNDGYRVHLVHGAHCRLDFSHISADIWTCDDLSCQARNKQRHLICCTTSRKTKYCYYYTHLITTFYHVLWLFATEVLPKINSDKVMTPISFTAVVSSLLRRYRRIKIFAKDKKKHQFLLNQHTYTPSLILSFIKLNSNLASVLATFLNHITLKNFSEIRNNLAQYRHE